MDFVPFGFLVYGRYWRLAMDWWFSSLHLWIGIECAYYMAIVLIYLNVYFSFLVWNSKRFMGSLWMVVVVMAMISMSGVTFHPIVMRLLMSGWYFIAFWVTNSLENLS